ncbi:hypothetical protein ACHAXS_012924 [Conticribra weissflogii]
MTFKTIPITLFLFLAKAAQLIPSLAMATSNIHSSNIYSTHNEMIWEDIEGDYEQNLIHIPLRSRYSVLRERNLLHLIEQDADLDTTFMYLRWATSRNEGGAGNHRALQNEGAYAGEGTHFIDVFVGNPAQKRILAVSSGADFTAFPCQGCTLCGNIISFYQQSLSATFSTMPCGRCVGGQREDVCDSNREFCVARGYNLVDKSAWTAYEARDVFYVGGADAELEAEGISEPEGTDVAETHGFPLVFACQTEASGWYASQVQDGIMGFSTARTSFVNQMVFQDKLKYPRFCMCFEKKVLMGSDMRSAGVVTLGGYNPRILDSPMVYVQNIAQEGETRYKVYVRSIYFRQGGGQSIVPDRERQSVVRLNFDADIFNSKNGGTILDSGVPMLVFDESIQESFQTEWKKMVGQEFTLGKLMLSEDEVMALPTIIIQIRAHDGVDTSFDPRSLPNMAGDRDPKNPFDGLLAIPATNYMERNPSTGTYRARIVLDSKLGSFLGINAMEGHAFVYDLREDRIGFSESYNCKPKNSPAGLVDDDMFELPTISIETSTGYPVAPLDDPSNTVFSSPDRTFLPGTTQNRAHLEDAGGCVSATCISFVTVGYALILMSLAVAYHRYRPRDRSKHWDNEIGDDEDEGFDNYGETEVLNPEFEQHIRHGPMAGFD